MDGTRARLLEAAVELARSGGPDSVGLREIARRAGVSHNTPYRHFADHDALLEEVVAAAMVGLGEAMRAGADAVVPTGDAAVDASSRLSAVGRAYVHFAIAEPGLFATAFRYAGTRTAGRDEPSGASDPAGATAMRVGGVGGADPYGELAGAVQGLIDAGRLTDADRAVAEVMCWSSVHGFAMLCTEGPGQWLAPADRDALLDEMMARVDRGLG